MLYLEKPEGRPIRFVIECVHPEAFQVCATALDCFAWDPKMCEYPPYQRAVAIMQGEEKMKDGERLIVMGGGQ